MRNCSWYSKVLFALLLAAFAYFVWPTPWRYHRMGNMTMRTNRFTERSEMLWPSGWAPAKSETKLGGLTLDEPPAGSVTEFLESGKR